jgi:hypothetical protein
MGSVSYVFSLAALTGMVVINLYVFSIYFAAVGRGIADAISGKPEVPETLLPISTDSA